MPHESLPPKLLIFDCDGVLVDSETIACRVDARCLTEAGFPVTAEELYNGFVGRAADSILASLAERHGRPAPADLNDRRRAEIMQAFRQELRPMPGIKDVLARNHLSRCVASSSHLERVALALDVTGLRPAFGDNLFSTSMVARGKPAPDVFLFAASKMGAEPAASMVIEDSPSGVEAGKAAGMRVIGFAGGSHCGAGHAERLRAAGADLVILSMAQLSDAIKGRDAG